MKHKVFVMDNPKCFGEHKRNNDTCRKCIFLFDCVEKTELKKITKEK